MHPTTDLDAHRAAPDRAAASAPRRWLLPVQLLAAAVGAWLGMGFGQEISGTALGVLLAANCALFGSLAAQTLADVVERLAARLANLRR
jgi:hypothetical protein